jgi:hypothetical protein
MIILLRGHIRKSFDNENLYNLIKKIYDFDNRIKIYIHTWNKVQNDISWRNVFKHDCSFHVENIDKCVTSSIIKMYFKGISSSIKHIIIDDDSKIKIIGNIEGNIRNTYAPLIGWKNYWYSKYNIIRHIKHIEEDVDEPIVNLRFDILEKFYAQEIITDTAILDFIKANVNREFTKNVFLTYHYQQGIDNIYMGNIITQYKLIKHFYLNLDAIIEYTTSLDMTEANQERMVFDENANPEIFNDL